MSTQGPRLLSIIYGYTLTELACVTRKTIRLLFIDGIFIKQGTSLQNQSSSKIVSLSCHQQVQTLIVLWCTGFSPQRKSKLRYRWIPRLISFPEKMYYDVQSKWIETSDTQRHEICLFCGLVLKNGIASWIEICCSFDLSVSCIGLCAVFGRQLINFQTKVVYLIIVTLSHSDHLNFFFTISSFLF